MTENQKSSCTRIISDYQNRAGAIGASSGLKKLLENMMLEIANVFGHSDIDSEVMFDIIGIDLGLKVNKVVWGIIPVLGKAIDKWGTAFMVDEVGWKVVNYYDRITPPPPPRVTPPSPVSYTLFDGDISVPPPPSPVSYTPFDGDISAPRKPAPTPSEIEIVSGYETEGNLVLELDFTCPFCNETKRWRGLNYQENFTYVSFCGCGVGNLQFNLDLKVKEFLESSNVMRLSMLEVLDLHEIENEIKLEATMKCPYCGFNDCFTYSLCNDDIQWVKDQWNDNQLVCDASEAVKCSNCNGNYVYSILKFKEFLNSF